MICQTVSQVVMPEFDIRLHHSRRRLGRMRGCKPAERESGSNAYVCWRPGPPDRHPLIHIPLGMMRLITHPKLNWGYQTLPQKNAEGRSIYLPRGRVLGGSSSINGMVYMRGHPLDYDDWAKAGNLGWSYRRRPSILQEDRRITKSSASLTMAGVGR